MTISPDALIVLIAAWAGVQLTGLALKHRAAQKAADRTAARQAAKETGNA